MSTLEIVNAQQSTVRVAETSVRRAENRLAEALAEVAAAEDTCGRSAGS